MAKWKKEIEHIEEMLHQGRTLREIAEHYNVTKQWISLLIKRDLPHLSRTDYGVGLKTSQRRKAQYERAKKLYNRDTLRPVTDLEYAQTSYFTRKKQNTKHGKWEFSITMSDLEWPTHCPILGLELDWFAEYRQENSPSIDRINSREGYIPGNVQLVSWRANRIKNDGSANEHRLIAEYLENNHTP